MNLSWYPVARHELAGILTEEFELSGRGYADPYASKSDIMLGIHNPDRRGIPVVAIALVGDTDKELFSWISTYAEEIFPLTQFCRVCSIDEWTLLKLQFHQDSMVGVVSPIWSSVILGEMLGQADADTQVAGIPLARANACFSFALARTLLLYPNNEIATHRCAEKLSIAERDPRFGPRPISVDLIWKVWTVALSLYNVSLDSFNVLKTMLQIVSAIDKQASSVLATNNLLLSDSAEDRVEGFDAIADAVIKKFNLKAIERQTCSITLAAAAVLAGRGTTHIHLLSPTAKLFPEILVWYGLFSGVLGPRGWDKAWTQQTKGVERALRQLFRPDEPVAADICWPEYEWLAKTYNSPEALSMIPKTTSRSLTIELLPGVNCQFRFGGQGSSIKTKEGVRTAETDMRDEKLAITERNLARAIDLLEYTQHLLRSDTRRPTQQSLLEEGRRPLQRTSKNKTNKKSP